MEAKKSDTTKMTRDVISQEQVTRLYLVKHHLFQKAKKNTFVEVVGDACGLHAQASQTPYLSLWNRVEGFENSLLDEALYKHRTLVKTWCMRGTLHVVPSDDLPVYNQALRRMWFEHHGRYMRAPDWPTLEERKSLIYPKILEALAEKPLRRKELDGKVRAMLKNNSLPYQRLFSGWGGILKETAYQGLTVHAQPCNRESCFARLDKWLPDIDLNEVDESRAQERLLLKYLRGYGPASQQDFMIWSGLMAGNAKRAIKSTSSRLQEVKVEDTTGQFWLLKEDLKILDAMSLKEKTPARLLPKFDSILLGYKARSRIIREEHKRRVFKPKVGDIAATVLVNGHIVGTWKTSKTKKTLTMTIEQFEGIQKEDLDEVKEEARRLSRFLGFDELKFSVTP